MRTQEGSWTSWITTIWMKNSATKKKIKNKYKLNEMKCWNVGFVFISIFFFLFLIHLNVFFFHFSFFLIYGNCFSSACFRPWSRFLCMYFIISFSNFYNLRGLKINKNLKYNHLDKWKCLYLMTQVLFNWWFNLL